MKKNSSEKQRNINFVYSIVFAFLIVFIPLREVLATYISSYVKAIPDLIIFGLLVYTLLSKRKKLKFDKSDFFAIMFVIVAAISTIIINKMGLKAFILEARSMFLYYVLYFVIRNTDLDKKVYNAFLIALQISFVFVSLFAIVEKLFSKTILFPPEWAEKITSKNNFLRVYSFFNNPNTFGFYNFLVMVLLYLNRDILTKRRIFILFPLAINNIWMSGSRSTILICCFFVLMMIIKNYKLLFNKIIIIKFVKIVVISLLLITVVNLCYNYFEKHLDFVINMEKEHRVIEEKIINNNEEDPTPNKGEKKPTPNKGEEKPTPNSGEKTEIIKNDTSTSNRIKNLFDQDYVETSKTDGRIYKIKKGLEVVKDNLLLGSGFGSMGDAASLMHTPKDNYLKYHIDEKFYMDNEYMKNFAETGIIGIVLFILLLLLLLISYIKNYEKFILCLSTFAFGLFTNVFEVQIITFMFIIGLCAKFGKESNDEK